VNVALLGLPVTFSRVFKPHAEQCRPERAALLCAFHRGEACPRGVCGEWCAGPQEGADKGQEAPGRRIDKARQANNFFFFFTPKKIASKSYLRMWRCWACQCRCAAVQGSLSLRYIRAGADPAPALVVTSAGPLVSSWWWGNFLIFYSPQKAIFSVSQNKSW
jgi:hypothetical protein